jgi:hypothetical protein
MARSAKLADPTSTTTSREDMELLFPRLHNSGCHRKARLAQFSLLRLHGRPRSPKIRRVGKRISPLFSGGEGGIRTHGTREGSTVFESVAGYFGPTCQLSFRPFNSIISGRFRSSVSRLKSTEFLPRICTDICTASRVFWRGTPPASLAGCRNSPTTGVSS